MGSSLISALRLVEGKRSGVNVAQVLRECIDDLKIAIDSLEPAEADLLSLLGALRFRLGRRLADAGIALHWRMSDLPPLPWLDAQAGLHILRILQEIFTNIAKHSGASQIQVSTEEAPAPGGDGAAGVSVRVEDNGAGFVPPVLETLQPGRRGLANVQARVRALAVRSHWCARENGGTSFILWLPLQQPAAD